MVTASEFGDVVLRGLASLLRAMGDFYLYLMKTGHNETTLDFKRGLSEFWEIWYYSNAAVTWFRKLLFGTNGFVWQINHNITLENKLAEVVSVAANNSSYMIGDAGGNYGMSYIMRVLSERVHDNPDFVYYFWQSSKNLVMLVADALKAFLIHFPG